MCAGNLVITSPGPATLCREQAKGYGTRGFTERIDTAGARPASGTSLPHSSRIFRYTSYAAMPNSTKIACSTVVSGRSRCRFTSRMAISAAAF